METLRPEKATPRLEDGFQAGRLHFRPSDFYELNGLTKNLQNIKHKANYLLLFGYIEGIMY